MNSGVTQAVSPSPGNLVACDSPEPGGTSRKVYINGMLIEDVNDMNININSYGGQNINLHINPKKIRVTEESIFIDQQNKKKKRFTKKQLRDLIIENLDDNMEAVTWIKGLKLNGRK